MTRIRTGVAAATTQSTNHYTITASYRSPRRVAEYRRALVIFSLQTKLFLANLTLFKGNTVTFTFPKVLARPPEGYSLKQAHAVKRSRQDSNLRGETPMDF